MRTVRSLTASAAALTLAVLAVAGAARAEYIVFLHSFGEWTVICGVDEPTKRERCRLSAPPPTLPTPESGPRLRLDILEGVRETPRIDLHIHHAVDTRRPVSMRVDQGTPYEVLPPRTGDVAWRGQAAGALLAEMTRGKTLAVRFFEPGAGVPRERLFALGTFSEAFGIYRQVVAEHRATGG